MWLHQRLIGLTIIISLSCGINAQQTGERICVSSRFTDQCTQLQRGNSEVQCVQVQDSIECAQRIRNRTADFGVFTAESALQIAYLGWDALSVIKELRHQDRAYVPVDFESVVIVRADHQNGLNGLQNALYCHPGLHYDKPQRWSERFLKHFERTVTPVDCNNTIGLSPAEIEVSALAKHFKAACRPGLWSNDVLEDAQLKKKYPSLCELCDSTRDNCSYENAPPAMYGSSSHHEQALICLVNKGQVAYVSLETAQNFFLRNTDAAIGFAYLCTNGSKQAIADNTAPCTWLRQPWKMLIASNDRAAALAPRLNLWLQAAGSNNWQSALREIITADSYAMVDASYIQSPTDYIRPIREIPVENNLCSTQSTWCTTSIEERDKCLVVRAGGITTGVLPVIECRSPSTSIVTCLSDISGRLADFMGIDSNFGYLARHPFNLTTALYAETENEKYSSVVAVVKNNSTYTRFENLRGAKACFAEFNGIASMAFVNIGKSRGFLNQDECDYGLLLGQFFKESCAPGAQEIAHSHNHTNPGNLCALCRWNFEDIFTTVVPIAPRFELDANGDEIPVSDIPIDQIPNDEFPIDRAADDATTEAPSTLPTPIPPASPNCAADATNRYYGNQGALRCLHELGDVAILELQFLNRHALSLGVNPNDYRVLCRNGSLADRTGFDVDLECALTTIVDGEVVVRRDSSKTTGIINALASFDKYFLNDPDFKMYNIFSGTTNLLFKDSTLGLVSPHEDNLGQYVQNYMKLFADMESCQGSGVTTVTFSLMLIVLLALLSSFF